MPNNIDSTSVYGDPVKPICSDATIKQYNSLTAPKKKWYKDHIDCNLIDKPEQYPKGYIGSADGVKGKLFPWGKRTVDLAKNNKTGTCPSTYNKISLEEWKKYPISNTVMGPQSFCNIATVGETKFKHSLAKLSKELLDTASQIYTKIQNLEKENLVYYKQHRKLDSKLLADLETYNRFYNDLLRLQRLEVQRDTLGGQVDDAQLKSTSGYYQFVIWATLATITFGYTIYQLRR